MQIKNAIRRVSYIACGLILALLASAPSVDAQFSEISRVITKTGDGSTIEAWLPQTTVVRGSSLRVNVKVTNGSSKTFYLVRKSEPEIDWRNGDLLVEAPLPLPIAHGGYDYTFLEIPPRRSITAHIDIPTTDAELGLTRILLALGFVNNKNGIARQLEPGEDPVKLRGPLANRMRVYGIGQLEAQIVGP